MTTAWAHLPNAAHIDKVLASLKAYPGRWGTVRTAARDAVWSAARGAAWDAALGAARDAAWYAALGAIQDAAWIAARDAVQGAVRGAAWDAALGAAWDAIAALIAYDDAGQFMKLPAEQLKVMHRLDPYPMYLLLQPAAVIFAGDVQ